jgi:deoxycytidine triphosphate deaminase
MVSLTEKRNAERAKLAQMMPSEDDPNPGVYGILLSDQITYFARNHNLICPFNPENLKPAGYELTVGDEYFLSGEFLPLTGRITIPPFEVAVIKTGEILRLPRYMIARWNIRVRHAYSGLLWVGGPQVDPGYVGHLFCPIYNLSDKPVTLNLGDALALMDFQKTTPYDKDKPKDELVRYVFPPQRVILEDYGIDDLKSALFTRAGRKLDEFEESIKNLESRFVTFTQISFAIFALVIGLLALSSKSSSENALLSASWVGAGTVAMSVSAILISFFSYLQWRLVRLVSDRYAVMGNRAREAQDFLRRKWWAGIFATVTVALAVGLGVFFSVDPMFTAVRRQQVVTKTDVDTTNASIAKDIGDVVRRLNTIEAEKEDARRETQLLKAEIAKLKSPQLPPADSVK